MPANSPTGRAARLPRDRRGAAALEFAIVSIPFVGMLIGLTIVAYYFFLQESLDYALTQSVRQVQLGQVPSTYTASDFAGKIFCPALLPFASCANVIVTVVPVTDYYSASAVAQPSGAGYGKSGGFCIGAPGQTMFARVVYAAPFLSTFYNFAPQATIAGSNSAVFVTSAAFANENPSGTPATQSGAC